jgi:hypothetical protein
MRNMCTHFSTCIKLLVIYFHFITSLAYCNFSITTSNSLFQYEYLLKYVLNKYPSLIYKFKWILQSYETQEIWVTLECVKMRYTNCCFKVFCVSFVYLASCRCALVCGRWKRVVISRTAAWHISIIVSYLFCLLSFYRENRRDVHWCGWQITEIL